MPNPILARADALMSRRRQTLEIDDVPTLTEVIGDAIDDASDIPVLTDLAQPEIPTPPAIETPASSMPTPEAMTKELARRIEQRLVAALPRLIDEALREYLAERTTAADKPHSR